MALSPSPLLLSLIVVLSLACHQAVAASFNSTSWNYDTGRSFLVLSYAAYCPKADLHSWSCVWCNNDTNAATFRQVAFASAIRTDGFAYIAVSANLRTILVSFRGTQADSLRNWITDLKVAKMSPYQNYTGVEVHTGFQNAYLALKDSVISSVKTQILRNPSYSIVVTGHSLGGALATLAAVDISRLTTQTNLWTYGSPRVGNKNFYTLVQNAFKVSYRVVNNRDMVAHLPPRNYDFWHVATEVWERGTSASDFKVCNNSGEDPSCSDSRVDISIVDHLNYFGLTEGC